MSEIEEPHPAGSVEPTADAQPPERMLSPKRIGRLILGITPAVAITLAIIWFAPEIRRFEEYGYPGIFLISLIGNATIAFPLPSLAVTFAMGAVLNWVFVGLVAGIGEALGETTGYLAGYGGSAVIENQDLYQRLSDWMAYRGMLTIFVLSAAPNPFFDLAGIAAGASKYGYHKFLFACWLGKTLKTLLIALAGAQSLTWVSEFLA